MTYQPPEPVSPPPVATSTGGYPVPPQPSGSQPSGPPSTPHIPPDDLDTEDPDAYADPRRNWKRSGALLGGWAGTWIAVLAVGIIFYSAGALQATEYDPDTDHRSPTTAVKTYFEHIFEKDDQKAAEAYRCDGAQGMSTADISADIDPMRNSDDSLPGVDIGVNKATDAPANTFWVRITVELTSSPQALGYEVTAQSTSDDEACVASVEHTT